jgi:hypothetical protein
MTEIKRATTSRVLVGLLLAVAGVVVAFAVIVIALMVAAAILPDHNLPLTR